MLLHQEFIKAAKSHGDRAAMVDRSTLVGFTYFEALVAALVLSNKFREHPEDHLGILIPNSAGAMLSIVAALMAGKTPVMLNYSGGVAEACDYAREKCGYMPVVTSQALMERLRAPRLEGMVFIEEVLEGVNLLDKMRAAFWASMPRAILLRHLHGGDVEDDAVVLFTSGSERLPKAVQLSHKNIGANVRSMEKALDITPEDVMLSNLPLFHVYGHSVNFWLPILNGMTVVTYANPLDFKAIPAIVREEGVTVMAGTPAFLRGYLMRSEPGDFDTVRLMVAGADRVPDALREGFREKHNIEVYEGYGTTETSPTVSVNLPGANKPGSIGRVLEGVEVKIVDVDTGEELSPGREGKIMVKGDLVMKGYLGEPGETAERIRDGWYDTGDMGMMDEDGFLWHRGRLRRFTKVAGEMVSLVAVEDALASVLPETVECCVVEAADEARGAMIVAAVTGEVDTKEVWSALSGMLPNVALPRRFVVVDELPRMLSGKVDFRTTARMVGEILGRDQGDEVS